VLDGSSKSAKSSAASSERKFANDSEEAPAGASNDVRIEVAPAEVIATPVSTKGEGKTERASLERTESAASDRSRNGSIVDTGFLSKSIATPVGTPGMHSYAGYSGDVQEPRVVVIPPNVWRNTLLDSPVGERSYLVPATAQDVVYANRKLVKKMQVLPEHERKAFRRQLLSSTFVYDYHHPILRAARNFTSRITRVRVAWCLLLCVRSPDCCRDWLLSPLLADSSVCCQRCM